MMYSAILRTAVHPKIWYKEWNDKPQSKRRCLGICNGKISILTVNIIYIIHELKTNNSIGKK